MKRKLLCVVFTSLMLSPVIAAEQKVSPPIAQFWMDAATNSMAGMEEMEDMPAMAGMMGNSFGMARMGMASPGKWLDSALHTKNKPAGTEGKHGIPETMKMGASLTLLPVEATKARGSSGGEQDMEKPKGRMLFYWGCGESVRAGQPRVLDFSKASIEEYSKFMVGRHAPDRGAKAIPGRSVWPNKDNTQRVPKQASLLGQHGVTGEGVPADWRFAVSQGNDFMPPVRLSAAGDVKESIPLSWAVVDTARGYFLSAMSGREDAQGVPEMILWSSSNDPDPGWGLMDYLAPARVDKMIKEKVVLSPDTTRCAVPKGIFANTDGAMVRMIAYGPELNLAHPPRPTDVKVEWKPDWAVRLRLKSMTMAMLGQEMEAPARNEKKSSAPNSPSSPADLLNEVVKPANLLKGLFGN